ASCFRASPASITRSQPKDRRSARYDRSNLTDRIGGLRNLWRRHDDPYRHLERWACLSLLHLLELCDQGKNGVQGTLDPYGQTRLARHRLSDRTPVQARTTDQDINVTFFATRREVRKPQWPTDRIATGGDGCRGETQTALSARRGRTDGSG